MGLILYVALIILGIRFPKSRKVTWAMIAYMLILFSFVERDGDFQQYKYVYDIFGDYIPSWEPGFVAIMWLCKQLHFPYGLFRLVVGSIYIFGVLRAVKSQTANVAFSVVLFSIFPFFFFVSAMRSSVAMAIILNVIPYLQDKSRKGSVKYVVGVLIATMFHYSSLFFLAFLLTQIKLTRRIILICTAVSAVGGVVLWFTDWISGLLSLVTQNQKVLQWFTNNASKANLTGAVVILVVFVAFTMTAYQAAIICKDSTHMSQKRKDYAQLVAYISILMLFAYPLFIFSSVFMRQLFLLLPCVIISCANAAFSRDYTKRIIIRLPFIKKSNGDHVVISVVWPILLALGLVMLSAFYFDWPYLKQGQSMFDELIYFPFSKGN